MVKLINISQLASLLNLVNSKTKKPSNYILRYWEKEFKQIKPMILKNRRYYSDKQINIIKLIKFLLKDKGMTIEGAKKYLSNENSFNLDQFDDRIINSKKILKSKLQKISKIAKDLKKK